MVFYGRPFFVILQQKRIKFTSLIKKVKNNETSYLLHLKFERTSTYKTQTAIPTFIYESLLFFFQPLGCLLNGCSILLFFTQWKWKGISNSFDTKLRTTYFK